MVKCDLKGQNRILASFYSIKYDVLQYFSKSFMVIRYFTILSPSVHQNILPESIELDMIVCVKMKLIGNTGLQCAIEFKVIE